MRGYNASIWPCTSRLRWYPSSREGGLRHRPKLGQLRGDLGQFFLPHSAELRGYWIRQSHGIAIRSHVDHRLLSDRLGAVRANAAAHVSVHNADTLYADAGSHSSANRRKRARTTGLLILGSSRLPLVHCLCIGKGVNFIRAAFLSTAAPRRGTLPDLEQQPSPKLFL
jgi:hypothetical protein